MGEFEDLAEFAAAAAHDWNDGTLDSFSVVYAAARHLSPPAIVTGEIEDLVEIAAATLRGPWIGMASLFQQDSAVGVS